MSKSIFREYVKSVSKQQEFVVCSFGTEADVIQVPEKAKRNLI
jgi:hypothetical protein